ncbi:MAG: GH13_3 / GH13 / GH13_36, partial [uncultured Solirubrobacteraceae bacterium]
AHESSSRTAGTHPDREPRSRRRRRPLPGQALRRGRRRGLRRRLPRRARPLARRGALPRPGCGVLERGAHARGGRGGPGRRLGRVLPGRCDGPLGVRRRGLDRRLRHLARRAAAQGRCGPDRPVGRARRGRGAARARRRPSGARRPRRGRGGARHPARRRRRAGRQACRRARSAAAGGDVAGPAPPRRRAAGRAAGAGGRSRAGPLRLVVRAVPALLRRPEGRRAAPARAGRVGLRRPLPAPDPPDRAQEPQGAQQLADRRSRRSRLAVGDRRARGRPRCRPSRARHGRRRPPPRRHGARAGHRHRPGLRDPVLGRPPVADRAPGVVPPPPRRDAQVRREPAQALPGHLQRQLGLAVVGRALAGAAAHRPLLGRLRDQGLPRRQPAHQAAAVLGVADPRGPRRRPRRRLPRRGLHQAHGDAGAGQARLLAVLHVLHVEELALGAHRVPDRAGDVGRAGVLPPQLLRQHARHPPRVPAARRSAGVHRAAGPGRDAEPVLRHLLGLRELRERAGAPRLGGVHGLREVRGQGAAPRRAAAAARAAPQRGPAREPGAAAPRRRHLPGDPERRPDRLRQARRRQHGDRGGQPRPAQRTGGGRRGARPSRPAARLPRPRRHPRPALRLAHRAQLRPPVAADADGPCAGGGDAV